MFVSLAGEFPNEHTIFRMLENPNKNFTVRWAHQEKRCAHVETPFGGSLDQRKEDKEPMWALWAQWPYPNTYQNQCGLFAITKPTRGILWRASRCARFELGPTQDLLILFIFKNQIHTCESKKFIYLFIIYFSVSFIIDILSILILKIKKEKTYLLFQ